MLHKAQEGVKGGTLAGGSPFAGGPAARSLMRTAVMWAVIHPRPGVGGGWAELAVLLAVIFTLSLRFHPISLVLAQRNGVEPQRKALGVVAPP